MRVIISIAIDAMGGDFGEKPIVEGVIKALNIRPFNAILVDKNEVLKPLTLKNLEHSVQYEEAKEVFSTEENTTDALKRKDTSICKAIKLVKNDKTQAVVSTGHSGASMSLATLRLGKLQNVLRPAIATLMPNITGTILLLDVNANTDCKNGNLFQFAVIGRVYTKEVIQITKPRIALLSSGEEECKGNELTKETHQLMKKLPNFIGDAEGCDIFNTNVDVLVCDGFSGNVILESCEGVAGAIFRVLKADVKADLISRLGAVLMRLSFIRLKKKIDWQEYDDAPLPGVEGCVIINHGKSDARAIQNAIFQALHSSEANINRAMKDELSEF